MKKRKVIFLILICFLIVNIVKSNSYLDTVVEEYSTLIPFWQNMSTCTPDTVSIPYLKASSPYAKDVPYLVNKSKVYTILEEKNNSCHVKIQNYDCYMPMDIAGEYAKTEIDYANKKINEIKKSKTYSASSGDAEIQKIAQYNQTYCKLQYSVSKGVKIN